MIAASGARRAAWSSAASAVLVSSTSKPAQHDPQRAQALRVGVAHEHPRPDAHREWMARCPTRLTKPAYTSAARSS